MKTAHRIQSLLRDLKGIASRDYHVGRQIHGVMHACCVAKPHRQSHLESIVALLLTRWHLLRHTYWPHVKFTEPSSKVRCLSCTRALMWRAREEGNRALRAIQFAGEADFANKVLSAMRSQFDGHWR